MIVAMHTGSRENEGDREVIVDNEVVENPPQQNDFHGVIRNYKPRRRLIEPVIVFLFTGFALFETALPNTVELQYCRTVLNLTEDQCFSPTVDFKSKEAYEKFAATFNIYRSCIEVTIPSLISFFVGPWSDTYGRKPLILSSLIGYAATYSLWTFASSIATLSPMFFLLFSLPLAFSGGSTTFILGAFCYLCDITTLEDRAWRLGLLQAMLFLGTLIGMQLCPVLLSYGYTVVYGAASALIFISLLYVFFFLSESIIPSQVELNSPKRNPFHLHHIRELYECCYTKQTPKIRLTLVILTMILSCSLITLFGESGIMYLFLQRILNWDLATFTKLGSFMIIVNGVGTFAGTWFLCYVLKLDDLLVLSIATFIRVLSCLVMIFAFQVWHIYFSKLLAGATGVTGSLIRSFLSRVVAKDELGKVFSLLASTESATPLFATLLYSTVFNMTMSKYPGAVFYLSAFLVLFMLICLAGLVKMYVPDPSGVHSNRSRAVNQNTPSINED